MNKIFYVFTLNDIFEVEQIENIDNQLTQIPKDNFVNKLKNTDANEIMEKRFRINNFRKASLIPMTYIREKTGQFI